MHQTHFGDTYFTITKFQQEILVILESSSPASPTILRHLLHRTFSHAFPCSFSNGILFCFLRAPQDRFARPCGSTDGDGWIVSGMPYWDCLISWVVSFLWHGSSRPLGFKMSNVCRQFLLWSRYYRRYTKILRLYFFLLHIVIMAS